jgi:mRNA interferase HicA
MKRAKLLSYLNDEGCVFVREGRRHTVVVHPLKKLATTVPRHNDIDERLADKICKDVGVVPLRRRTKK